MRDGRGLGRASSGPKTATGKAQSAQNAFRHGFNVPIRLDTDLASDVEALAQRIVGKSADADVLEAARRVPESILADRIMLPSRLAGTAAHAPPSPIV